MTKKKHPTTEAFEALQAENEQLRQRIAELEAAQQAHQPPDPPGIPYQAVFEHAPVPLVLYQPDGTLVDVNRRNEQLLNIPREHLRHKFNLLGSQEAHTSGHAPSFQQAAEGTAVHMPATAFDVEHARDTHHHGNNVWTETTYFPVYDEDGTVCYVGAINLDVSSYVQVEHELRESQSLLQAMLDNAPFLFFAKDLSGRLIMANRQLEQLLNKSRDELLGKTDHEFLPQDEADRNRQNDQEVLKTRRTFQREEPIMGADGTLHYYLSIKFPLFDTQGEPFAVCGIATDVTEQRQAEKQARIFQQLVEGAQDSIILVSLEGTLTYANAVSHTLFGYGDEIVGMTVADLVAEADVHRVPAIVKQVQETGAWQDIVLHRHKDGNTFPLHSVATIIRDERGAPLAIGSIHRDMTERVRLEQELRSSEEYLRALFNAMREVVMVLDSDGRYLDFLSSNTALLARPPEELVGQTVSEVLPPEEAEPVLTTVRQVLETGEMQQFEYTLEVAAGEIYFAATVAPVTDTTVIWIARDITELKQASVERLELQSQVINAQRAALRELSSPLIPIADNVVIMPLIGTIDTQRAQQIMEALLEGVAHHQAEVAILDITGVQMVDTQVANALIQAAQAVRLLGAQVILTGISPAMAQTLVTLGADLSSIVTRSNLQRGIAYAMQRPDAAWLET